MSEASFFVVLHFDPEGGAAIARAWESNPQGPPFVLESYSGRVSDAVRAARERHGGCPLGVSVADDNEVIWALEAGADEARVLGEDAALGSFLDAVTLRARLRRDQENAQTSAVQVEKLAALGVVVAGVAHEVNNPLAALLLTVEALRMQLTPLYSARSEIVDLAARGTGATHEELVALEEIGRSGAFAAESDELIGEIQGAAQTIAEVVRDLKAFAREERDAEPECVQLTELIDQVARIVGQEIVPYGHLEQDFPEEVPPLVVPRTRLIQVITNILINAGHAIREVSRPAHRVRISVRVDDDAVALSVSDTGPGIAPNVVPHIFDPFFTTKRERMGTGLGLSISRAILVKLGGDLLVESVHGVGATFIAVIPRPGAAQLLAARRGMRVGVRRTESKRRRSVLIVDGDERVLKAYARAFAGQFDVLLAFDAEEAIGLLESGSSADVVLAELDLPGADGPGFQNWLQAHRPELATRTVFVSAAPGRFAAFLAECDRPSLIKPVSRGRLLEVISDVLSI